MLMFPNAQTMRPCKTIEEPAMNGELPTLLPDAAL